MPSGDARSNPMKQVQALTASQSRLDEKARLDSRARAVRFERQPDHAVAIGAGHWHAVAPAALQDLGGGMAVAIHAADRGERNTRRNRGEEAVHGRRSAAVMCQLEDVTLESFRRMNAEHSPFAASFDIAGEQNRASAEDGADDERGVVAQALGAGGGMQGLERDPTNLLCFTPPERPRPDSSSPHQFSDAR